MRKEDIFVYVMVFLAVVAALGALYRWWRGLMAGTGAVRRPEQKEKVVLFDLLRPFAALLEPSAGRSLAQAFPEKSAAIEKLLTAGGLDMAPSSVFAMQVLSGLAGAAVGAGVGMLLPGLLPEVSADLLMWAPAALFAIIGWMWPRLTLESHVQARKEELVRSLPFAIDLMASAMRAGLEFGAAMRYFVGMRMKGPLTDEFAGVLTQIELGKTRVEALKLMAERLQIEAFTAFVGVVAYGTEIGASISETLAVHGEELRRARFHLAERKAQRAPSLMILPMALFILPAVFVIVITPVMMQMSFGK